MAIDRDPSTPGGTNRAPKPVFESISCHVTTRCAYSAKSCQALNQVRFQSLSHAVEKGSPMQASARWSSYWPPSSIALLLVLRAALYPTHGVYSCNPGNLLLTLVKSSLSLLGVTIVLYATSGSDLSSTSSLSVLPALSSVVLL